MDTHSKRIIYYASYTQISSQLNCYIFKINCLLDNGITHWTIGDNELQDTLSANDIIMKGRVIDIDNTEYSIINCDHEKMNMGDFYTYNEAKGKDILMWREFNILYDINIKQPIFGKYSNIDELDKIFEYIITGALSQINI